MSINTTTELSSVNSSQIVDGAVTSAKIAAGSINSTHIGANAVVLGDISAGAVDSAALADSAVVSSKINSGSATSGQILQANGSGGVTFVTSESSKPYWLEISGTKAGTSLGIPNGPYAIENFGSATNVKISPSTATVSFASGSAIRISATSQITEIGNELGINWSNKTVISNTGSATLMSVSTNSSTYLATTQTGGVVYYTSNPTSNYVGWTAITTGLNTSLSMNGSAYGGGTWVIGGRASSPAFTAILATSTDLTTWTSRTTTFSNEQIYDVFYGGDRFVAVGGGSPGVSTSPDGITWTSRTGGFQGNLVYSGTYGNSTYLIVGEGRKYAWSIDGATFTASAGLINSFGTTPSGVQNLWSAAYGANTWVVGNGIGQVSTSPSTSKDSWTLRTTGFGSSDAIYGLVYDGSKFIAVSGAGNIRTSPDAITWTARTSNAGSNTLAKAVYSNGVVVAVGALGTVVTSDNKTNIVAQPITYSSVT